MQENSAEDRLRLTQAVLDLRRSLRASVRTDESLPVGQVEILQILVDSPSWRVGDLTERLHLANSTVSGLITTMIGLDLIERSTDSSDRRVGVVTITATGRDRLQAWETANLRRISLALDSLESADRRSIVAALGGLEHLAAALVAQTQRVREASRVE